MHINKGVETDSTNENNKLPKRLHSHSATSLVSEKDKFIQVIVGEVKAEALKEFLNTDKGQNMFDTVCENKVRRNMSSILHKAGAKAKDAFQGLYDLWFDDQGEKTEYFNGMQVMR